MPEIDALVLAMQEWEVHSLRGLVTNLVIETQLYARAHPEAQALADRALELKQTQYDSHLEELKAQVVRAVSRDSA